MNEREKHELKMEMEAVREDGTPWEDFDALLKRVNRIEEFLRAKYLEEFDSFEVTEK